MTPEQLMNDIRASNLQVVVTDKKLGMATMGYELAIVEARNMDADKYRAEIHALTDILLDHKASVLMLTRMLAQ